MRSKANIKGHPLHPILVSFPISLLTGALLLDVLSMITNEQSYARAAVYAEALGLLSALMAAVPGLIDYHYTVPPDSSAKTRAIKHGLINSGAVIIFTVTFLLRLNTNIDLAYVIAMEVIGFVLLCIAGWLGGILIIRNQIGIDHRYANAGKWQEETIHATSDIVELKNLETLKLNQMKLLKLNGKRIVIARTEKGIAAFEDRCSHRGGSLADGSIACEIVQCPWHGSQFNVATGEMKAGPAKEGIKVYEIIIQGQKTSLRI